MSCSANGDSVPGSKLSGQVALVNYIADPLGSFLDSLCRELVPGAKPHSHISVLPPRPVACEPHCACDEICRDIQSFRPFYVTLGDVEVFPSTNVIYLSVIHGQEQLRHLHNLLNKGWTHHQEPFKYHPHVTLAQELSPEVVAGKAEFARDRWRAYTHDRVVHIENLSFVQNQQCSWIDLQDIPLGRSAVLV